MHDVQLTNVVVCVETLYDPVVPFEGISPPPTNGPEQQETGGKMERKMVLEGSGSSIQLVVALAEDQQLSQVTRNQCCEHEDRL